MNVAITSVTGGSGTGGNFQVGDTVKVTYTLKTDDGDNVPLSDLDSGSIYVSGPTSNYQPVLARQTDLASASVQNTDGSYTYTFTDAIPSTYLPPLNDTTSFGIDDGELQGQALLDGTYTVGIETYANYTIEGSTYRDAGNAVADFLFGAATAIDTRAVVAQDNCNQCHNSLRAHGGFRRNVRLCVLCHTAGAEDGNAASVAGGTPGVTIDFKVMIHRIHNGAHLPSVLGVATNSNGSRNYSATPVPYKILGFRNSVNDFSNIMMPLWPSLSNPMPRDEGYSSLTSSEKSLEDTIRGGVVACSACHGDPDGSGPLSAPADGGQAYSNPTRAACGSCHDDVDWSLPYVSNQLRMPPQTNDNLCSQCHTTTGSQIAVTEAHTHPLLDPAVNPGLNFAITALREAGTNNGDGNLDPGETVEIDYAITDDSGNAVDPSTLSRMEFALSGPTTNRNILAEGRYPTAALSGASGTARLPDNVYLEYVGASTAAGSEVFTTSLTPHWNVSGAATEVRLCTPSGASTTLSAAAAAQQNYIDVVDGSGFSRGDYIAVIDASVSTNLELLRVQWVNGNRLWFSSIHSPYDQPWLRSARNAGDKVMELSTAVAGGSGTEYSLNASTGTITEVGEFGTGILVAVSYTTDFRMPSVYPPPINDTPAFGQAAGEWAGLTLQDGTYTVGLWGELTRSVTYASETTSYNGVSLVGQKDFTFGNATTVTPAAIISSGTNCERCHSAPMFHGNHRRGFDTCVLCHGTAGSEDRPQYVAPNAPATDTTTIDFRNMLHKIHTGSELTNASTYTVVGFGSGYPNNYSAHTYQEVEFPAFPGGVEHCTMCHGSSNTAWQQPTERLHSSQTTPTRAWGLVCGSCHDSNAATAHIDAQTASSGYESCTLCHGPNKAQAVELMHRSW